MIKTFWVTDICSRFISYFQVVAASNYFWRLSSYCGIVPFDDSIYTFDKIKCPSILTAVQALIGFQFWNNHQHLLIVQAKQAPSHKIHVQRLEVNIPQ